MGAVVRIWLKSLIDTFQWGRLHSALVCHDNVIVMSCHCQVMTMTMTTSFRGHHQQVPLGGGFLAEGGVPFTSAASCPGEEHQ